MNTNRNDIGFENLEERICLTVSAGFENGILQINGNADGEVQITGTENGLDVTDNGTTIGSFDDVNAVYVLLDMEGDSQDDVLSINLNDQTVERVFGFLGNGNNVMDVAGSNAVELVIMVGGENNDVLNVDVATDRAVLALMRDGNDSVNINADTNWLFVREGKGDDSFTLGEGAMAAGMSVRLGGGTNVANVDGDVENRAAIMGGSGNDTVNVSETASIGGKLTLRVGDGDNTIEMNGVVDGRVNVRAGNGIQNIDINSTSIGGKVSVVVGNGAGNNISVAGNLQDDLYVRTGDGDDSVSLIANISGGASVKFGDGENSFTHTGNTNGDLRVTSLNADDVFAVDGTVGGETLLTPGEQAQNSGFNWAWGWLFGSGWGWGMHRQ